MFLGERQKVSIKRIKVFILSLVLIIAAFLLYGQKLSYGNVQFVLGGFFDAEIQAKKDVLDEDVWQPIEENCVTADGLSAVSVFYTMEWLGAKNEMPTDTVSLGDGEPSNISGNVAADAEVMRSTSSTLKTVYFYTSGNGSWNGWTKDCDIYYYAYGDNGNSGIQMMTKADREYTLDGADAGAVLWEVPIDTSVYTTIIFLNSSAWGDGTNQTVDVVLKSTSWGDYTYPCFALDGGNSGSEKTVTCLGDLKPLSQAGKPMYFYDMTSTVTGTVRAVFANENGTKVEVSADSTGAYVIPADEVVNSVEYPYTTVHFQITNDDGTITKLGDTYNLFNDTSSGTKAFHYDETSKNTFYYGVTEKSNGTKISSWGAQSTASGDLVGKTLYFDKLFFPVADGGKIRIGNGTAKSLVADSGDAKTLSYTFGADEATQETILTFIAKDGTEYHFLWSDLGTTGSEINKVTLNNGVAAVTEKYVKANTIFFDATLSKLVYSAADGTNGYGDKGIPNASGSIRFYATGDGVSDYEGNMSLVSEYTSGSNTWSDVYKVDLPEGYTSIAFSSFDMSSITNYGWSGESTIKLTIPTNLENPCFYADSSDDIIYNSNASNQRGGYWDEVYTVRDPEKEGNEENTITVVDIPKGTETRETNTLYLSTTFYDYYTDYELNGFNRDNYGYEGNNHRIYQPFRQFDQALSEYYQANSASSPIYWGNFQNYNGSHFSQISGDLQLFGSSNTNKFYYENNSMWKSDGTEMSDGNSATQGLVSTELNDGKLMIKTSSGVVEAPFLNESFLTGDNAKNTVLGKVYNNVHFPFTKEPLTSNSVPNAAGTVDYWVFDSTQTTLRMQQDSKTDNYYLATSTSDVKGKTTTSVTSVNNFFPFNDVNQSGNAGKLNYGFASKIEFKFRLTKDGTVTTSENVPVPIEFNFAGDDDVWVFIDGKLALDFGGGHGVVSGRLNFKDMTYYVSGVKDSGNSATGTFTLGNGYDASSGNMATEEHTLTMFYMERGLWESNMYISFNFPDENQLEVEKQIDETDVNQELFTGLFDDVSIFPFTIHNLATHYEEKSVELEQEIEPIVYNNTFNSNEISIGSSSNKIESVSEWAGKEDVVHWYAQYYDNSKGTYLSRRWGIIIPAGAASSVDVSKTTKYLQFSYYAVGTTPAWNKMYIELEDSSGVRIGGYLNGRLYGTSSAIKNGWGSVTVKLEELSIQSADASAQFDYSSLKNIKFSYNDPVNFYLDDFTFLPATSVSKLTGFVTKQYEIPDYGSATTGELEPAKDALYTLTDKEGNSDYHRVGSDGGFVLADGEIALFRDQFRRGSYIALKEAVNTEVFATSWTMYEDGLAVTSTEPKQTPSTVTYVNNEYKELVNLDTIAVDDGRIEVYKEGTEDGKTIQNGYDGTKPDDSTFVFRSYSNPDTTIGLTKLKVSYTNKVKVGSLKLTKIQAEGSDDLEGEYVFTVTFTNIAGMGLEGDKTITKTVALKVGETAEIAGIPVNTEFTIVETMPGDKSFLKSVTEQNDLPFTFTYGERKVTGKIEEEGQAYDFEFENMLKPVINISLVKEWENANGEPFEAVDIPGSITIQIQRRKHDSDSTDDWHDWKSFDMDKQDSLVLSDHLSATSMVWEPGYGEWERSFVDLNKYVNNKANPRVLWEYRIVEVNSEGSVIENGGILGNFQVHYSTDVIVGPDEYSTTEDENHSYTITNTSTVELKVIKTNASGEVLPEVEFMLEKQTSSNPEIWELITTTVANEDGTLDTLMELVTDIDGVCTFENLPFGTYRLTEKKTVEGYTLLKAPVIILIDENGYKIDNATDYITITDNIVTISIVNRSNIVLPTTGWTSSISLEMIIILLSICLAICFMYRNMINKSGKDRRHEKE